MRKKTIILTQVNSIVKNDISKRAKMADVEKHLGKFSEINDGM